MERRVLALLLLLSPFLICGDPTGTIPGSYIIQEAGKPDITTPYPLHFDLSSLPPGEHIFNVKAVSPDGLWESSLVPFSFTKPDMAPITGIGLTR